MVAAWISAETGVGPSIASGSQTCSGNCADLPTAPQKISSAMTVAAVPVSSPAATPVRIVEMSSVPKTATSPIRPSAKPTSPTRFVMKAFFAARPGSRFVYQKPINRYEERPTSSHAAKTTSRLFASTSRSIENMKRFR